MTDLITKRITELSPAESMAAGDLMVVRKTGENFDRKITKENILESLGNPAIKGFVAIYNGVNQITLTAVNGSPITAYKDKMVVSFEIPAGVYNPNANFTLKINNLDFKVVKQFSIDATIVGVAGKYIEAIFDTATGTFYQTNDTNDANSSIEYTVGGTANAISLTTINGLTKTAYYDGMTISLVTKFATNANVTIKVDNLVAKPLINQAGQPVNNLIINQPLFAIYNPTLNAFITQVNTFQVVTNEYNVASTIITTNPDSTTFNLVSSIGLPKQQVFGGYYEGMTATFTVKFDELVRIRSSGAVSIKIDGFADAKILTDPDNDPIANDVLLGQTIIARYDGTKFIKNRFAVEVDDGEPEEILLPPLVPPFDPLDPNYQGDPRDPANALNENSVDDQGRRIFDKVFTVGSSGATFTTVTEAFNKIIRDFGINGERLNGQKIALVLLSNYITSVQSNKISTGYSGFTTPTIGDLRFVTIFAQNNGIFDLKGQPFLIVANYAPIFNLKLISTLDFNVGAFYVKSYLASLYRLTTISLGKNTIFSNPANLNGLVYLSSVSNIEIKYGAIFNLTNNIDFTDFNGIVDSPYSSYFFNKVQLIKTGASTVNILNLKKIKNITIANTTINAASTTNTSHILLENCPQVLLSNVTCINRSPTSSAIETKNSIVSLKGCNFLNAAAAIDIKVNGSSQLNTISKDPTTTGTTNQVVGQVTQLGQIIQEI